MELIDKDKIREWLQAKKKREGWCAVGADVADVYYARGVRFTCDTCKDFLDTLEVKGEPDVVKEADLEKEATEFIQTKEFVESKENPVLLIAKHFFELGLKARKGE